MCRRNITLLFLSLVLILGFSASLFAATNFRSSIDDIVKQIVNSMESEQKKRVAIMDFRNIDHSVSKLGMYLSETLITKLFQTHKFKVIERSQLGQALQEIGLAQTGVVDRETAQEVGKVLGVDSLVIGTVTDLVDSIDINARLISTETGEVFAVASSEIQKDAVVAVLMGQKIKKKEPSLAVTETPKVVEQTEEEIPEGFKYLVVNKSGAKTPLTELSWEQKGRDYFDFHRKGGGKTRIKFSDCKMLKFFERESNSSGYIKIEFTSKSGKKYEGFIYHERFYGTSDLGAWESLPHELQAIYVR
jgi:curli biogenesis system outer membrane secretion channel CsgG